MNFIYISNILLSYILQYINLIMSYNFYINNLKYMYFHNN